MRVNVFGLGYVGCVSAACFARDGHDVTGIDVDPKKVELVGGGASPIVEPELPELIRSGVACGRLTARTGEAPPAEVSVVCVGTPSDANGSLGLRYLERVVEDLGAYLKACDAYHVVNIRSTVLPGTVESLVLKGLERASGKNAGTDFGLCMNPEFMRESTSVRDFYDPPFTVIGQLDERSGETVAQLYAGLEAPMHRTSIRVAETVKYVCNAFHALKVVFANEIGNICKSIGGDSHDVMDIFCEDTKLNLSPYYMKPGFSFGGSCLPKDVRALLYLARQQDVEAPVLQAILPSNRHHLERLLARIEQSGFRRIGLLGLSFKAGTDDLRESPMVELVERLLGKGYHLAIYDPDVSLARLHGANKQYIEKVIPHISSLMTDDVEEVVEGAELILIGNRDQSYGPVVTEKASNKHVLDLVRLFPEPPATLKHYDGICW